MKRFLILALTVLALGLFAGVALAADAPKKAVEMKFPGDGNKFAPIMFEHHAKHLALPGGCKTCHHKWDGKGAIQGCRVAGCHSDTSAEKKKEPTSYDSAFHARASDHSCVGCHTLQAKANPATKAPTKCNQCHTKK